MWSRWKASRNTREHDSHFCRSLFQILHVTLMNFAPVLIHIFDGHYSRSNQSTPDKIPKTWHLCLLTCPNSILDLSSSAFELQLISYCVLPVLLKAPNAWVLHIFPRWLHVRNVSVYSSKELATRAGLITRIPEHTNIRQSQRVNTFFGTLCLKVFGLQNFQPSN